MKTLEEYYQQIKHLTREQIRSEMNTNCCCTHKDRLKFEALAIRLTELQNEKKEN